MNIHPTARVSFGSKLDLVNPRGIFIGRESYIASGARIFTHDFSRGKRVNTYIGEKCFIGADSIILPGLKIGDQVIVGAGTVVTKNVENNSIIVGNPGKVIRTGIVTRKYGQIIN